MNFKRALIKTIASSMAAYMVMGNLIITGVGVGQVIAEDAQVPEIVVESSVQKYIPYANKYESGVVLQEKVLIGEENGKENHKQIENMKLEVRVPEIKGIKPSRISVIKSNMQLTAGKEKDISQNYNWETGLLNIECVNSEAYNQYQENAKDELEIIYIYPETTNIQNAEAIETKSVIKAVAKYKTESGSVTKEKEETKQETLKETTGQIATYQTIQATQIYKGYMYSNEKNGTAYETTYKTTGQISIVNKDLADNLTISLEDNKYQIDKKETETNTVVYKSTTINEQDFRKLYGQDGKIEIYIGENKYASVEYSDADEKGNRSYQTTYYTEHEPENKQGGKIEYSEGTTGITIKTTKPVAEGTMNIYHEKAIAASKDYTEAVNKIKNILETNNIEGTKLYKTEEVKKDEKGEIVKDEAGNEVKETKEETVKNILTQTKGTIELKEPLTQMQVDLDNNNLSTLANNKTKITIKLNDTNSTCKLYEAGEIKIKLPENITNAKIVGAEALYENGIKITKANIKNGYIILTVEGSQTSYDTENVSGGVNIIIDVEIDIEDTVPSHTETMEVTYADAKVTKDLNIVSKYGLLMLSKTTGYDENKSVTTIIDGDLHTVQIPQDAEEKTVEQTIDIVNNYGKDISNMQLVGRVGYVSNGIKSTFDATLTKPVEVSNKNAKVYYSENKNATYTEEGWKEEFTNTAKAYKIALPEEKLLAKEKVQIKITTSIQAKVGYNQETYLRTEANYVVNEQNGKDTSTIGMLTEKKQIVEQEEVKPIENNNGQTTTTNKLVPINLSIEPKAIQSPVHSGQIVTYVIKVQNTSKQDLKDIIIEDVVPQNAIYTYKETKERNIAEYIDITKDEEKKNVLWKIEKLKAEDTNQIEIMLTMGTVSEEQDIINKINLKYNNQIISAENKLKLKPAAIEVNLQTDSDSIVNFAYRDFEEVMYTIKVKNITEQILNNIVVEYNVPENIIYSEGGEAIYNSYGIKEIKNKGNITQNTFRYTINSINPNEEKEILVKGKVAKLQNGYEANISGIAKVIVGEDVYQTNINTVTTKQSAFEITQTSNVESKQVIKTGEEVEYTIKVKNIGIVSNGFEIKDAIPAEIEVKELEYQTDDEESVKISTSKQEISISNSLAPGETLTLKITGTVKEKEDNNKSNIVFTNNVATLDLGEETKESNKTEVKVEQKTSEEVKKENTVQEENKTEQEKQTYAISGIAWVDLNKDGKIDGNEQKLKGIQASLLNMSTGKILKDESGNTIYATTDENGYYKFANIEPGKYVVVYNLDTTKYSATVYQKEGEDTALTSKVIINTAKIDNEEKKVGKTDYITIETNNVENINVGLIENPKFDISLNKEVSNITVIGDKGTKTKEYKNTDNAKVKVTKTDSDIIVKYKFKVKNEGTTDGYVNNLVNDLPEGLEFSSEMNQNWYKAADGKLYTTGLAETTIKPGEEKEVELVLTKKVNNKAGATVVDTAQVEKTSNLQNTEESNTENNIAKTTLKIKTQKASPLVFVIITIVAIAIIGAGAYIIKKKYFDREKI